MAVHTRPLVPPTRPPCGRGWLPLVVFSGIVWPRCAPSSRPPLWSWNGPLIIIIIMIIIIIIIFTIIITRAGVRAGGRAGRRAAGRVGGGQAG